MASDPHGAGHRIDAGAGRDADWFAGRGHRVTAVEPVETLRMAGERHTGARPLA